MWYSTIRMKLLYDKLCITVRARSIMHLDTPLRLCLDTLLLLLTVMNLSQAFEPCYRGANSPYQAAGVSLTDAGTSYTASPFEGDRPVLPMSLHCVICHTVSQVVPLPSSLVALLILVTMIALPVQRVPSRLLLAPTPPPPRAA